MGRELFKQLYKRNTNGFTEIQSNFHFITVEAGVSDDSQAALTAIYGEYELVVDTANGKWYLQFYEGQWIGGTIVRANNVTPPDPPDPPDPPTPSTNTAYCGWAASQEAIDVNAGTAVTINNNKFTTVAGENYFMWFAIPATKNISTVENTAFSGDFIQDDLVQLPNVTIDDIEYKVYCYEFIGLPGSNTYYVTLT